MASFHLCFSPYLIHGKSMSSFKCRLHNISDWHMVNHHKWANNCLALQLLRNKHIEAGKMATTVKKFTQKFLPEPSRCWAHIGNVSPASKRFLCLWSVMPLLSLCCFIKKKRIVRILFSCMLPQIDNCCTTTVYRHLQCMSLLIDVSGVLRGHYTIESFYDRKLWFLLWCLSLFLSLNLCFLLCILDIYLNVIFYECICFLPYCVRKWHNKTVQSISKTCL